MPTAPCRARRMPTPGGGDVDPATARGSWIEFYFPAFDQNVNMLASRAVQREVTVANPFSITRQERSHGEEAGDRGHSRNRLAEI